MRKEENIGIGGGKDMARMRLSALAVVLLLAAGTTWAEDDAKDPAKEAVKEPPKDAKKLGSDEAARHTHSRAGYPLCVSSIAIPTDSCGYCGYYVGGGSALWGGSAVPASPIPAPGAATGADAWSGIRV